MLSHFFFYYHYYYFLTFVTHISLLWNWLFLIFYSLFVLLNKFYLNEEFQNFNWKIWQLWYTLYNCNFAEEPSTMYGTLICKAFEIVSNEIHTLHNVITQFISLAGKYRTGCNIIKCKNLFKAWKLWKLQHIYYTVHNKQLHLAIVQIDVAVS